jgi:hypothetical protein
MVWKRTFGPPENQIGQSGNIAAITGHSMHAVDVILDKYLARTDKIALAAIAKLERVSK